jgi:tetratricopeptide (TPR) repeat protein
MNPLPRQKLREIIAANGPAVCSDAQRCIALLNDACPDAKKEIFALATALTARVPAELLFPPAGEPPQALLDRLTRRLTEELALAEEPARWAVESWAHALGFELPDQEAEGSQQEADGRRQEPVGSGQSAGGREQEPGDCTPHPAPLAQPQHSTLNTQHSPPTPTPETRARVEQLLRDAHIQRVRGQGAAAEALCKQALQLDPDDVMGLEMLGDFLAERGDLDDSLANYRRAFEIQQKPGLEEKIARLVVIQAEQEHEQIVAQLGLQSMGAGGAHGKRRQTVIWLLVCLALSALGVVAMLGFFSNTLGNNPRRGGRRTP